jgi:hypothetical protein
MHDCLCHELFEMGSMHVDDRERSEIYYVGNWGQEHVRKPLVADHTALDTIQSGDLRERCIMFD